MNKLAQALQTAIDSERSNKRPTFRAGGFRFTLAKPDSRNPGYVYIKDSQYTYLGKIAPNGVITGVRNPTDLAMIQEIVETPLESAMTEGKETGTCCCCGRTLTNPLSIELGIGPICRGGWFPETDTLDSLSDELDLFDLDLEEDSKPTHADSTNELELSTPVDPTPTKPTTPIIKPYKVKPDSEPTFTPESLIVEYHKLDYLDRSLFLSYLQEYTQLVVSPKPIKAN